MTTSNRPATPTLLRMLSRLLIPAFLLLVAAPAVARQASRDLAALEAKVADARKAKDDAELLLEQTYLGMEAMFDATRGDVGPLSSEVAEAVRTDADDIRERLTKGRGGRTPTRNAQLLLAAEGLNATLAAIEMHNGFRDPLAQHLAPRLLDTLLDPEVAHLAERVQRALEELFPDSGEFAATWNEHLFQHVREATAFANAHQSYVEAGQQLAIARSPDRFDESGHRLPPGMVQVKGGSYSIGPHHGWERKGFEKRAKRLSIKPFYIDKEEVTNAEYHNFWQQLEPQQRLQHLPRFWEERDGDYRIPDGKEDHPVVGVTFNDALAFAAWAGKRLPTEDEWEAAARGEESLKYPWGDDYQPGYANDRDTGIGDTSPVGAFPEGASPFGCLDMAGNVEEWTASSSEGEILTEAVTSNLVQVVIRGGNYDASPEGIDSTFRWVSPGLSTRKAKLGFRCAMDPPKRKP